MFSLQKKKEFSPFEKKQKAEILDSSGDPQLPVKTYLDCPILHNTAARSNWIKLAAVSSVTVSATRLVQSLEDCEMGSTDDILSIQ